MKLFLTILSAILVAGVLFVIAFRLNGRWKTWEREKARTIRAINLAGGRFEQPYAAFEDLMRDDVKIDMTTVSRDEKAGLRILAEILDLKPFLGLNPEEKKMQALAKLAEPTPIPE